MTLTEAMPLISASTSIVSTLVQHIINSVSMTEEQRKLALQTLLSDLDATVIKVKNVRFDALENL